MAEPITINIQWKGTVACLDFVCPKCEAAWHVDTNYDIEIECTACGTITVLPNTLPLPVSDEEIVAYACNVCCMAIEANARDDKGELLARIPLTACPACGSEKLDPLTAAQYKEQYED